MDGLRASSKGKRGRFAGGKKTVIDGPFAETKELVAGFWLWQVRSKEEALEWLKRAPFREGEVEIRQVYETADFAPADPTGDLLASAAERQLPLAEVERGYIRQVLDACDGNVSRAARILGIDRRTLYRKLE